MWQSDPEKVSKFMLLKAREQWRANNAVNDRVNFAKFLRTPILVVAGAVFSMSTILHVLRSARIIYVMLCAISYHLHNLKNLKNGTKPLKALHMCMRFAPQDLK